VTFDELTALWEERNLRYDHRSRLSPAAIEVAVDGRRKEAASLARPEDRDQALRLIAEWERTRR